MKCERTTHLISQKVFRESASAVKSKIHSSEVYQVRVLGTNISHVLTSQEMVTSLEEVQSSMVK